MTGSVDSRPLGTRPYVLGGLTLALGAVLTTGGLRLALLGGSRYYVIAGVLYLAIAVLLLRRRAAADRLCALLVIGTLGWAINECGLAPWALLPRLWLPALLGLWFAMPWVRSSLRIRGTAVGASYAALAGALLFGVLILAFVAARAGSAPVPLPPSSADPRDAGGDWPHYGRSLRGTRFSPLAQLTPSNVAELAIAWIYRSGERPDPSASAEATPLEVGDTLYTCTPNNVIVALDAATGALKWRHDPKIAAGLYAIRTCRGVAYFEAPHAVADCSTRILEGTNDSRLIAVDAKTGAACRSFGTGGVVSLLDGIGGAELSQVYMTSPATIVRGHAIVGSMVLDNQSLDMPSGVIRSFDPMSGELQWAWDMGVPDRRGAPAPGEIYTRSTPNAWTTFAADEELGLVYIPTGNPSPDFWGAKRRPFDEAYGSAIVALDIDTGRVRWSFQTVHHDLWDYDVSAQPALVDLQTPDGRRPALVQATKRGDIFVLDRRTGVPIVPVAERAVPAGAATGDWLSKTQPFSALGLPVPTVTEASMWGVTPIDQLLCRIEFRESRYEGMFTPPGTKPTIVMPGLTGVVDWGSVSIDVDRGVLITNYMTLPWRGRLIPRAEVPAEFAAAPLATLMKGSPFAWRFGPWLNALGVPCSQPPWGSITAIDLNSRRVLWDVPLGTGEDSGPLGIPSRLPITMGVPSLSGTVTTRGGLAFISGTADQYVRAIDVASGQERWRARLPAGGQATPMTYMVAGRQFLVVTAGGHSIMRTKFGDYTIAYALPKR